MAKGIDCATTLTQTVANNLKAQGYDYVGRYLGNSWKSMKQAEAQIIINAGLKIISIWETAPTSVGYFSNAKGKSDALAAVSFAKSVGQPAGSVIYFAVDYDTKAADLSVIADYFNGVKSAIGSDYIVGAYGEYDVIKYLHDKNVVAYYMQTYAWSGGQKVDFAHVYQWKNDTQTAGISADLDVINKDPGAWGQPVVVNPEPTPTPTPAPPTPKPAPVVVPDTYTVKAGDTLSEICAEFDLDIDVVAKLNGITNYGLIQVGQVLKLKTVAPTPAPPTPKPAPVTVPDTYTVKAGDTLSEICAKYDLDIDVVAKLNGITNYGLIQVGQVLKLKAVVPKPAPPQPSTSTTNYTIKPGDTLSGIAAKYHTTVAYLKQLNHISDTDRIIAGKVIKVPSADHVPPFSPSTYTVKKGDTLSEIAAEFHTTVANLKKINRIADENKIFPGQVIKLK